jgi:hypothetical protein
MAAGEKFHGSNLKLAGYLKLLDNPIYLGLADNAYITTSISSNSLDITNLSGDIDINATNVYLNAVLISSPGLFKYQADYSGIYDNRTLVDKEYVDGLVAGTVTADNGLTESLNNVQWGGSLIQDTDINGAYNLAFGATTPLISYWIQVGNLATIYSNITASGTSTQLTTVNVVAGEYQDISTVSGGGINITTSSATGSAEARLNLYVTGTSIVNNSTNNHMVVTDAISNKGWVNAADYSFNFTPESLVTKRYVDNQILLVGVSYWDLNTAGELVLNAGVPGPVSPHTNNIVDLGSTSYRWQDLFIGTSINLDSTATINANVGTGYLSLSYFGTTDFVSLGVDGFNALNIYKDPIVTGSYTSLTGENTLNLYAAYGRIELKAYAALALIGTGVDADIIITDGTLTSSHDNQARKPIFIGTQNSTINAGLSNTVVIGGTTLTASNSDTVYLGNYVNINNAYTLPNVDGTSGQILKTNGSGVVTWQTDASGFSNLSDLNDVNFITGTPIDGDILVYNGTDWEARELPLTFNVSGAINSKKATNQYVESDGAGMFLSPFILPDNATLKYMSASCATTGTWTAEVHVNGTLFTGATVTVTAAKKAYIKFTSILSFSAGDEIQLYLNGTNIDKPRISAVFVAVP